MIKRFFLGVQIGLAIALGLFLAIVGGAFLSFIDNPNVLMVGCFVFVVLLSNILASFAKSFIHRYDA